MTPSRTVRIERFGHDGEGIAKIDGKATALEGTIPGELVRVERSVGRWLVTAIEEPSVDRVTPRCAVFDRCGGCTWQHVSADGQRRATVEALRRALPPKFREAAIDWVASPRDYGYRGRARLHWARRGVKVSLGFFERRAREIVDFFDKAGGCAVLVPALDASIEPLRRVLSTLGRSGELSLALGHGGSPVVSLNPDEALGPEGYTAPQALLSAGFVGAALWSRGVSTPTVAGDPRPVVDGADGAPIVLGIDGFSQGNVSLNAALVRHAVAELQCGGKPVLELYSGAGNFTVLLAREASRVSTVESDPEAVAALRDNLALRGLANVSARIADAVDAISTTRAETVLIDPPRTGAREVCEAIVKRPVRRLVYVSCDAQTLGRDLGILSNEYDLTKLTAFEMFPQTAHVELVASLRRASRKPAAW